MGPQRSQRRTLSMGLKTGIVGLPNVGKSTLFNALTGDVNAEAANYPFCTIEPNAGVVSVPDARLAALATLHSSAKVVPTSLEFLDIAGLVRGAYILETSPRSHTFSIRSHGSSVLSKRRVYINNHRSKGEGLGNQFLANIRECDAIVHVVRCFRDENVIHVDGNVDPIRDVEVIELELALSDLAQIERRAQKAKKDKDPDELSALDKVRSAIDADGAQARFVELNDREREKIAPLNLLTMKPVIFACNVEDDDLAAGNDLVDKVREYVADRKSDEPVVVVSAQVEAELVALDDPADRDDFLAALGVTLDSCGLRNLVRAAYATLGLLTYYTAGPTESRAWTIKRGYTAPQAAGVIHGDFERGFIKAETIAYETLVDVGDEKTAKEKGLIRQEGKDYVVQDGDVMLFRFNV